MDYIGIGGIIATLIVGILTCIVTWIIAKKSLKRSKLNYEIKVNPILSSNIKGRADELEIYYQNAMLTEPCLLTVNIINAGNAAIVNPPIKISAKGVKYFIPAYIEDVPSGYEELWKIYNIGNEECGIHLEHINKKQVVKARFYLDSYPDSKPEFICPMIDLELKETSYEKMIKTMDTVLDIFLSFGPLQFFR